MRDYRMRTPNRRPNRQPATQQITASVVMFVTLAALACSPRTERPAAPAGVRTIQGQEATDARVPSHSASGEGVPDPTSVDGEVVHGWPDTSRNPAGVYSWNGSRCAGPYCVMGFMHNGYGSGDVEIRIEVPGGAITDDGATAVTVAGHDGIYRRIDAQREEWIVNIEGTTIAFRLEARPGTSQADLADAHAIIESMRTEPQDNDLGFRLVFTLTTTDWDSG